MNQHESDPIRRIGRECGSCAAGIAGSRMQSIHPVRGSTPQTLLILHNQIMMGSNKVTVLLERRFLS
ncbi:hypothetical protein QYF50_26080, partial [Paenibacillus vini]|uniref:hypothetical protein n=1 Tax=Paenibacillus vini TaxID=1476024 RepID=UPI0025B6F692